jgi:cytosine/adenosine deaminase-related metal-dependent hydrolase
LLAVHLNYPEPGDLALLSRKGVHVVHCPRSHFYFNHHPFPLRRLASAGVNVCLGTDSLASVYKRRGENMELSMFAEMQELRRVHPRLMADTILRMATVNAAQALGLDGHAGVLAKGALADLLALPLPRGSVNFSEAVVRHQGPVAHTMIGGRWVFPRHEP